MEIGRKIYFDKSNGNVILDTGERVGSVVLTTVDYDFTVYNVLIDRDRSTVGVIELEYGQYAQDFREYNGYRVNPDTRELEFSYPDPNEEQPQEPVYQKSLSKEVEELQLEDLNNKEAIADLYTMQLGV